MTLSFDSKQNKVVEKNIYSFIIEEKCFHHSSVTWVGICALTKVSGGKPEYGKGNGGRHTQVKINRSMTHQYISFHLYHINISLEVKQYIKKCLIQYRLKRKGVIELIKKLINCQSCVDSILLT